jgi:UDP-N-acetyl-D-galactosamine dehydrogenase
MDLTNKKIAIIGLGYVGLPLAVEFAKKYSVIGFDINQSRVQELNSGHDSTLEVSDNDLQSVLNQSSKEGLLLSNDTNDLKKLYGFYCDCSNACR